MTDAQASCAAAANAAQTQLPGFGHRALWLSSAWGCTGTSDNNTEMHFYRDRICEDDAGGGTWIRSRRRVAFAYDVGTAYTGTPCDSIDTRASGTMIRVTGEIGCGRIDTPV